MAEAKFVIKESRLPIRKRFWWVLVGANGEPLCTSEPFVSRANARRGAEDARRNIASAVVIDRTE